MNFSLKTISLLCIAALVLSGCEKRKTLVELGNQQQILHIGNGAEPSGIDPHTTTGMGEYHLQMALFEGLVAKDPKTLETISGVADEWSISEDQLTYSFHIRDTARWSNGEKVTAQDFVQSWRRAMLPGLGNEYVDSLFVIHNAEKYFKGEIKDFAEVGVKALNENTLEVRLENPTPYFLQMLDHHAFFPVHVPSIERFGAIDDRSNPWTKAESFVGNGPFVIKEWTPAKVFSVTKSDSYWDAAQVRLKQINFYPIDQQLVESRMFNAGQLHKTEFLPTAKIAKYKKSRAPEYFNHLYFGTYFYMFNVNVKPLADPRVRKALAYSIERERITENVVKGGQVPAYSYTPPETLGYTANAKMVYDLALAKKLLAEAGYPDGKDFPTLELIYNTLDDHQKIALAIQQMWKKNLNINITLHNQEWKVFLNNQNLKNYQIARMGWIGDYPDPNTFLSVFVSDGGNNRTGWSNKHYDNYVALASKTESRAERYEYFQKAEAILLDEAPILPIYHYTVNYLLSSSVKGFYPNLMDYHPYKYMYLEAGKQEN